MKRQTSVLDRVPADAGEDAPAGRGGAADVLRRYPAVVLVVPAVVGLVLGSLLPRGPVTSLTAVATIAVAFLVGAVCGRAWRSAWAYLATPVVLAAAYRDTLAWARADGATRC